MESIETDEMSAVHPPLPLSTMHIDELPLNCLLSILKQVAKGATLADIVEMSFVNSKWATAVSLLLADRRCTSLKLFNMPYFYTYQEVVIEELELPNVDERFRLDLNEGTDWKDEDHLVLCQFADTSLQQIAQTLGIIFPNVTSLFIDTMDFGYVELLQSFPDVNTLAFLKLPKDADIVKQISIQIASMTRLRHLYFLQMDKSLELDTTLLQPTLARLESFTLHRYRRPNSGELVAALNPDICYRIVIGPFAKYHRAVQFQLKLAQSQPQLAEQLVFIASEPEMETPQKRQNYWRKVVFILFEQIFVEAFNGGYAFSRRRQRTIGVPEERQRQQNHLQNKAIERLRALTRHYRQPLNEGEIQELVNRAMTKFREEKWSPCWRPSDYPGQYIPHFRRFGGIALTKKRRRIPLEE